MYEQYRAVRRKRVKMSSGNNEFQDGVETHTKLMMEDSDIQGRPGSDVENSDNESVEEEEEERTHDPKVKINTLLSIKENFDLLAAMDQYDNKEANGCIKAIGKGYTKKNKVAASENLASYGFGELVVKMLTYFHEKGDFSKASIWNCMYNTLRISWNYTDCSPVLAQAFIDSGLIPLLQQNVTNEFYLEKIKTKKYGYIVKSSLSILANTCRFPELKQSLRKFNITEDIKPFLTYDNDYYKTLAVIIMASLLDESEAKTLEDTGAIPYMINCMKKAVNNKTKRRHRGFAPWELADSLAKMAINDANKMKIVDNGALPVLIDMLNYEKNPKEQRAAAETIWNLSFHDDVKNHIMSECTCVEALERGRLSENADVKRTSEGALWVLQGKQQQRAKELPSAPSIDNRHIFLSYNWGNQDLVVKISDQLKELGYKVWIDLDQMGGSTLEAMANGLEKAKAVIICMSEKYKLSPNCRTEAEYTFQLRKPILPLMMQRHYKPDGWLGMILGARFYVNMDGKYEFDHAFQMLLKEMKHLLGDDESTNKIIKSDSASNTRNGTENIKQPARPASDKPGNKTFVTRDWNKTQVANWLRENDMESLADKMQAYNGKLLFQLFKTRCEVPSVFFNTLLEKEGWKMVEVLQLICAMEDLYT